MQGQTDTKPENVICNPNRTTVLLSTDRKNLNNPAHIAAHLQAAQSQRTDPSLQKSCNLANALATIDNSHLVSKFRGQNLSYNFILLSLDKIRPK